MATTLSKVLSKLIAEEFSSYRTPESLILRHTTLLLMLKSRPVTQAFPVRVIDGGFEKALAEAVARPHDFQEILILRALSDSIPHYFTLFVEKRNEQCRAILMDASNCREHFASILKKMSEHFDACLVAVGCSQLRKIQIDTKSCMLFAYEHALLLSQSFDPFEDFLEIQSKIDGSSSLEHYAVQHDLDEEQEEGIRKSCEFDGIQERLHLMQWVDMPFAYVRHMQTVTGMGCYIKHQKGAPNGVSMLKHKSECVRRGQLFDSPRLLNHSLVDYSCEVEEQVTDFLSKCVNDQLLIELLGFDQEMPILIEKFNCIFSYIPKEQYVSVYRFLFSESPLRKKEIARITKKLAAIIDNDKVVKMIEDNQLNLLNLITHSRFSAIVGSKNLLTLLSGGYISESQLSFIRSQRQVEQLESDDVFIAIKNGELDFETFAKAKSFDLSVFRFNKENDPPKNMKNEEPEESFDFNLFI
jgi:hypothetical protein